MGLDLSYVNQMEDCGALYYDADGQQGEPFAILSDAGANMVRIRLWNDPSWTSYSNLEDVKRSMERALGLGMEVMLDFHYSDFWADPSRQWKPAAWNGVSSTEDLGDSLYTYTYETLSYLAGEGLVPAIVQVGNEINGNILIERTSQDIDDKSPGMYPVDWDRQVALLHRAIAAVDQVNAELGTGIRSLVHVAQPENATGWFAQASAAGLSGYDIIGISYYPEWSDHGIRQLGEHIAFMVAEYGREVMVVEIGYPWTFQNNDGAGNILGWDSKLEVYDSEVSREIQRDFMTEVSWLVKENGGTGIFYWEPAWVSTACSTMWGKGSHYDNACLFDFDNRLHAGAEYLGWDYQLKPPGLEDRRVVFRANLKGVDNTNGFFITGDFTGDPWQFIPLEHTGENWYELDTIIPGRSEGAYIFYNNDDWDDSYREEVPSSCAEMWDSHRKYVVTDEDREYVFAWSSCTTNPVSISGLSADMNLRYFPDSGLILLDSEPGDRCLMIADITGSYMVPEVQGNLIDVSHLHPGMYILYMDKPAGPGSFKFIR